MTKMQVKFKDLEIKFDGKSATINGIIDSSQSSFTDDELKGMLAAILQNLTNEGDIYGNPFSNNIKITGDIITGNQQKK